MEKFLGYFKIGIISSLMFMCCLAVLHSASSFTRKEKHVPTATIRTINIAEEEIEPQGLMVKLSLNISAGDGNVTAKVKNTFTLFPSTVWVYVELYSSETYQESYTSMSLVAINSTKDLNMNKSISATASTNGESRYWQARMRYKFDSNDWISKVTSTYRYDGSGNLID